MVFLRIEDFVDEFPGNSHASKSTNQSIPDQAEASVPKEPTQILKGKAAARKKSIGERMKDLVVDETVNFSDEVVSKVIVPTIKETGLTVINMFFDAARQAFELKWFGHVRTGPSSRASSVYRAGNGGPINYSSYSNYNRPSGIATRFRDDATIYRAGRRSNTARTIEFEYREDAEAVLDHLIHLINRNGHCTVGDLYERVGERSVSTDEKWGWDADDEIMATARINVSRGGFILSMPDCRPIT